MNETWCPENDGTWLAEKAALARIAAVPDSTSARLSEMERQDDAPDAGRIEVGASKFETWGEMTTRHAIERAEALTALREAGLTQTQAAAKLGIPLGHLNSYIIRHRIPWTESKQGRRA
tara:strand:+ start:736 stop:1092 length:357 start_codon:yes stop_codon:yes gene_type:complete